MLVGVPTSPAGQCDPRRAVRDILPFARAWLRRRHSGPGAPTRFLQLICGLEEGLTQRKRTLFLPESYGNYSDRASIYLTSAISGGSARRLEEAIDTYGPHRLVPASAGPGRFLSPLRQGAGPAHLPGNLRAAAAPPEPLGVFSLPGPLRPLLHLHESGDRGPLHPL